MKELEDYPNFPSWLRNFQTEFIGFMVVRFNIYRDFIKHISSLSLPHQPMIDLCSGSGEIAVHIFNKSKCFSNLILSDKFPNKIAFDNNKISYLPQSVDVLEMEFKPNICYTLFNAFHHFEEEEKLKIVQQIMASGSRAFIVEILEPKIYDFFKVLFATTVGSLLLTPFVRPFSFKRLFFTYILPVNIVTITFDGLVSVFKTSTVKQYRKLFASYGDAIKILNLKNNFGSLVVIEIQPK